MGEKKTKHNGTLYVAFIFMALASVFVQDQFNVPHWVTKQSQNSWEILSKKRKKTLQHFWPNVNQPDETAGIALLLASLLVTPVDGGKLEARLQTWV